MQPVLTLRLFPVGWQFVWRQVFPQAVVAPLAFVVEALAAFFLYYAFALATVGNDDNAQFRVYFSFAIPITAGCTNFHFSGNNQFWGHG